MTANLPRKSPAQPITDRKGKGRKEELPGSRMPQFRFCALRQAFFSKDCDSKGLQEAQCPFHNSHFVNFPLESQGRQEHGKLGSQSFIFHVSWYVSLQTLESGQERREVLRWEEWQGDSRSADLASLPDTSTFSPQARCMITTHSQVAEPGKRRQH